MKKTVAIAIVMTASVLFGMAARAEEKAKPKFEERKAEILKHIDERLSKMQEHRTKLDEHRTCVAGAADQAALKKCRDTMKAFMKEHRGDMKKMHDRMHEENDE